MAWSPPGGTLPLGGTLPRRSPLASGGGDDLASATCGTFHRDAATDEMAYYSLGHVLKDRLDLQGAKEVFSMIASRVNPRSAQAYWALGKVHAASRDEGDDRRRVPALDPAVAAPAPRRRRRSRGGWSTCPWRRRGPCRGQWCSSPGSQMRSRTGRRPEGRRSRSRPGRRTRHRDRRWADLGQGQEGGRMAKMEYLLKYKEIMKMLREAAQCRQFEERNEKNDEIIGKYYQTWMKPLQSAATVK